MSDAWSIDHLIHERTATAAAVTAEMERRDPQLFARYPSNGRTRCTEDTAFHIEHLAAALDVGEDQIFTDYVQWLVNLLSARNIPSDDIAVNFAVLAEVLEERYGAAAAPAARLLRAAAPGRSS